MRILVPLVISLAALACATLPGCSLVYRIDVQQGNYVTQDLVDRLQPGMTRAQVKQILGTPLLTDVFHVNRWDYYFSNVKGGKPGDRTRLAVYFADDKMVSVSGDAMPAKGAPAPSPPSLRR